MDHLGREIHEQRDDPERPDAGRYGAQAEKAAGVAHKLEGSRALTLSLRERVVAGGDRVRGYSLHLKSMW
jgi:hypothetical protein